MKFSEMPYSRPDGDELRSRLAELTDRVSQCRDFAEMEQILQDREALNVEFETAATLANVRHTIDTNDAFYDEENNFFDELFPQLQADINALNMAMMRSPFRKDIADKYGDLLFVNMELSLKNFTPDNIEDMQLENKLTTRYDKLLAAAQVPYEGEQYTLSQLTPFKEVADDEKRRAAWAADAAWGMENAAELDEIYDKLVKLRNGMAMKKGFKNYVEMGYNHMQRNDYREAEVAKFREAVVKYLVPVADRLFREQAARTGLEYPLSAADAGLKFRSGNPAPVGTPEQILEHGRTFYHELSPETAEFIDVMLDNELMDVYSRKGKSGGGYCTSIPKYKVPFIFANFNGTAGDVEVITHEAGHAYAGYRARNVFPMEYQWPSLESCEIHSMSMEFFAWPWAEGFFGEAADKFRYHHLAGAIAFIPYGTQVDHFQHIVYEKPWLSPAQRNKVWKELTAVYRPWLKQEGEIPFYGEGRRWQRQRHIYMSPFYYIDYCLAQTVALEFWAAMQQDQQDAWKRYNDLVSLAGTKRFSQLVAAAGLETPFGDAALKQVAEVAVAWLDAHPVQE